MSKIDLSKAKIGDKFRTRNGFIRTYYECGNYKSINYYLLKDEDGNKFYYYQYGEFILDREGDFDLLEQILDKPLDELIEEGTKQIKENDDAIAEEKELQRRQEVVELAEKLVTNELFAVTNHMHDMRELGAVINLDSPTEYAFLIAEEFVNNKSKYLENGKLC